MKKLRPLSMAIMGLMAFKGFACEPPLAKRQRVDASVASDYSNKQLFRAAFHGDVLGMTCAIQLGADIDAREYYRRTSLMIAAQDGYADVVKLLIEKKATIDVRDNDGWTPLMFAARNSRVEVVQALMQARANVNAQSVDGQTALHLVLNLVNDENEVDENEVIDIVSALLKNGANPDIADNEGHTPLSISAAQQGTHSNIFQLLYEVYAARSALTLQKAEQLDIED